MVAILRRVGVRLVIYLDDMLILNQTRGSDKRQRLNSAHFAQFGLGDQLEKNKC